MLFVFDMDLFPDQEMREWDFLQSFVIMHLRVTDDKAGTPSCATRGASPMFADLTHSDDTLPGESLVANATRQLRAAILTAELPPGMRLRTEALQERFGVSSSPLREALN